MPTSSEPVALQRFRSGRQAFRVMTTTHDAPSVGTTQMTTQRLQTFHLTSVDLRSLEGFFVRRRKVPRPNCLTPEPRTQSAMEGF